jgi:sodium/pantothenate symporter
VTLSPIDWIIFLGVPAVAWVISQRKRQLGTWRGYFLANGTIGGAGSAATYFGANLTFTSIFLILSDEAYKRGAWVFAIPVCWLIGTLVLALIYPKIRPFIQEGKTLHQVLGKSFNSSSIQKWASLWTIVAFVGTITLEFYGGIRLLQWAQMPFFQAVSLAMFLAFVVAAFTATGGFRGVAFADIILDIVTLAGTIILLGWVYYFPVAVTSHQVISTGTQTIGLGENIMFVVGMIIIFIPFQLCALDSWQRFAAWNNNNKKQTTPKWLFIGSLFLCLAYCVPILIGITLKTHGVVVGVADHPLKVFLDSIHLPPVSIGIVFAGFLAAIFSTADELLNCCALSFLFDTIQIPRSDPKRSESQEKQIVISGQLYTGLFALVSAGLAILAIKFERNISDMAIAVFSGQVLFTVPLMLALFFPQKAMKLAKTAKWSMIAGFIGIVFLVALGWMQNDRSISDAAPIGGMLISLLIYLPHIFKSRSRQS